MTIRATHTPGPWIVQETPGSGVVTAGSRTVAVVTGKLDSELKANAQLISSSPDLLAACRETLAMIHHVQPDGLSAAEIALWREQVFSAIEKAEAP